MLLALVAFFGCVKGETHKCEILMFENNTLVCGLKAPCSCPHPQELPSPGSSPPYFVAQAPSMAEGSRMMLCVMVLTVLAFNPLASLSPPPARPTVGDVPGRTILEEQSQAGGVCVFTSFSFTFLRS